VHLHGGTTPPGSDGWPDDAFPSGDSAFYTYPGEPRATQLWYHDHADMITRLNVAAGLAGLYLVRDAVEDKLGLPKLKYDRNGVPTGMQHELPLLIQDRNLELDQNNQFNGRMLHKLAGDGAEFYGPYTLVNGKIWPYVEVEPRQVRLRLLNGSNGRFYRLRLKDDQGNYKTDDFQQIGTDSGFLDHPVPIPPAGLTLSPAERADVILDLKQYAGKSVSLVNDYPMPMLPVNPIDDNDPDAPKYEEVLQFRVAARSATPDDLDLTKAFQGFKLDPRPKPTDATRKRKIYLIEDPPGTLTMNVRLFHDRVEEVVHLNDVEIWEIVNTTGDFHPFHIHQVDFEVFERQQFAYANGVDVGKWVASFRLWEAADPGVRLPEPPGIVLTNQSCPIDENEKGLKDTIRVGPMTVTRIVVKFGPHTGRYIYHCHILEHEDMEMMRPYLILPPGLDLMGTNFGTGATPIGPAAAGKMMPAAGAPTAGPPPTAPGHRMSRPAARKSKGRHS
jgi:spore coat protein A